MAIAASSSGRWSRIACWSGESGASLVRGAVGDGTDMGTLLRKKRASHDSASSIRQEYNAHQPRTSTMRIRDIMKPAHSISEKASGKKATNISLAMDVYLDAKNFGINISQLCEQKLREEIQKRKEQQWNEQHADFLAAYNSVVETEGVALQEWRAF
nr:type II toxin-antitoxin system CcdA family antitoxin [Massilia sp. PDC64]